MLLDGKVIVITGVGPGMGRKLALIAAHEGAKVAISARSTAFIDEVAKEVRQMGGHAIAVTTDVSDTAQCEKLIGATLREFGRVDGLVNSARARNRMATIGSASIDLWHSNMDVTCFGALRMAKAVMPAMIEQRGGAIVNISSISSVRPFAGEADYAVAKSALEGLTRQLAVELGPHNIRVNTARMGWLGGVRIDRFLHRQSKVSGVPEQQLRDEVTRTIPLGVIPPDEECAKAVLTLVSDYTRMVTGVTLDINGGQYMGA